MKRLAFIVSHPIQYYVPLYRRLANRGDLEIKVFFTWHGGSEQLDQGFKKSLAWDIPLTEGYEFEVVANTARAPGTHHFFGLRNPTLLNKVLAWRPDAVHLTGYAYMSHLLVLHALHKLKVNVLFRGDSHLLNGQGAWWRWNLKRLSLRTIYSWPAGFLCVGQANRDYYRAFGVPQTKLFNCPHSIETERFICPDDDLDQKAADWRANIGINQSHKVLLFAGKFEGVKQPLAMMQAFLECNLSQVALLMVGDGELGPQVREVAGQHPGRIRVLPFQNQSKMPIVYRLGDVLILPSRSETWGLAVNEAMACGRPALVSDRVGCHVDVVQSGKTGEVFSAGNWNDFKNKLVSMLETDWKQRKTLIQDWASNWSIQRTEETVVAAFKRLSAPGPGSSGR